MASEARCPNCPHPPHEGRCQVRADLTGVRSDNQYLREGAQRVQCSCEGGDELMTITRAFRRTSHEA